MLCTCAKNHYNWANELPEGSFERDGMTVRRFPADPLKVDSFARLQIDLSRGRRLSDAEEEEWLRSGVNSAALVAWLREHAAGYDRVVARRSARRS